MQAGIIKQTKVKEIHQIMKKLVAGNWKMNTDQNSAGQLLSDLKNMSSSSADILVCPPFVYLSQAVEALAGSAVAVGAQDCAAHENGAYTGDISAAMLRDIGCSHVILGHSERRHGHGESDETVKQKAALAHQNGLTAIICVGETDGEREAGREQEVVAQQLTNSIPEGASAANTVIAYEPVWAIGTGKTASPEDVKVMHGFIREHLKETLANSEETLILYGGSMKPDNAEALLATPNVDGGLIGGASLKPDQFEEIINAAKE